MCRRLVEVGRVRFEHGKRVEGLQKLGEFALRTVSVYEVYRSSESPLLTPQSVFEACRTLEGPFSAPQSV